MITTGTFINRQYDGKFYYYDLIFSDENGELLLRLGGVIFDTDPESQDFIDRATGIANDNLPDYTLTDIIF
jgi:hypothetical protein